jgi:hypothetical protein
MHSLNQFKMNNSKKDIKSQNKSAQATGAAASTKETPASNGRHAQAGREKGSGQSNKSLKQSK